MEKNINKDKVQPAGRVHQGSAGPLKNNIYKFTDVKTNKQKRGTQ